MLRRISSPELRNALLARAVRMDCLTLGGLPTPQTLRIFGRQGTQALDDVSVLPRALRRLVA